MIKTAFKCQVNQVKNNKSISVALLLLALMVVYIGYQSGHLKQSLVYLPALWLCTFIIDLYLFWKPSQQTFEVKNSKRESLYIILSAILGSVFLLIRFSGHWEQFTGLTKLMVMPLLLCTFPIALAVIMLVLKYKPKDLGFRLPFLIPALPVIFIIGLSTYFIAPLNIKFTEAISQEGLLATLFTGIITAALAEEFWRLLAQTRLAVLFNNAALGWLIASIIWAFMHTPKWYYESHNFYETIFGAIRIIPIGLMWGYMTYKTKSIFPAILVHGTNLWGLQNF